MRPTVIIRACRVAGLGVALAASAAFGAPATAPPDDARSAAAIGAVVKRHLAEVTQIYDTYLNAGVVFEGTVTVRFTIAPSGVVTASEVASSTTGCGLFDDAVAAAVMDFDFGPGAGDVTTVVYPFVFRLPPGS